MSKPLLNSTLLSVILLTLLGIGYAQQDQNPPASAREEARRYVEQVRLSQQPDGLHKAALAAGGTYVTEGFGPPWNIAGSLGDLVHDSGLIAIVRITSQETRLLNNGRDIATFYKFDVTSILYGALTDLTRYSIMLPGGTYVYSDKSTATVEEPRTPKLHAGTAYLVFCRSDEDDPHTLLTAFGSQGIFELPDDGATVHDDSMEPGDQIKIKYDKERQAQLLSDTNDAIAKAVNKVAGGAF